MMSDSTPSSAARPTIAAAAIARDEEEDIRGFLESVLPWVDEIVIIDGGSTDRTAEIVSKIAPQATFVVSPMDADAGFAGQRNKCIEHATADWILHMDIDERVTPELAGEIVDAVSRPENNAYRYRRLNFFVHRPMRAGGWQHWNRPQLARRGCHRFVNRIHERCVVDGGDDRIGQLRHEIWHLNDRDYTERVSKNLRYMQMTGDEILASGKTIRWYHLLLYPTYRGLRSYLYEGGYRQGLTGLVFALYTFSSTFNWYAYAWEKQTRIPRAELESELAERWEQSGRSAPAAGLKESLET